MTSTDIEGAIVATTLQGAPTTSVRCVSTAGAQSVIAAAVAKAQELGTAATIAVVDAAGATKAYLRMDGAVLIGADLATRKAYTAVAMGGIATDAAFDFVSGVPSLAAALPAQPGVALLGGGAPLFDGGELVGGVGVSAATTDQDVAIAEAAATALGG
jgi:uncharacterized protein GlcG (DUF336 family)